MDPNLAYSRLLDLIKNSGPDNDLSVQAEAVEYATDLLHWISSGGFLPSAMMTGGWNRRAAMIFLSAFIAQYKS